MGKVKGTSIVTIREHIREKYGQDALEKILKELGPNGNTIARAMPITWMPAEEVIRLYQTAAAVLALDKIQFCREVGAASATKDLPKFFKYMISRTSPATVFRVLNVVWRLYYDTGRIVVLENGADHVTVEINGFEDGSDEICNDIAGYCEALLAMLKLKNPRVVHTRCAGRGDSTCIFEGHWDM